MWRTWGDSIQWNGAHVFHEAKHFTAVHVDASPAPVMVKDGSERLMRDVFIPGHLLFPRKPLPSSKPNVGASTAIFPAQPFGFALMFDLGICLCILHKLIRGGIRGGLGAPKLNYHRILSGKYEGNNRCSK
eukprot:135682-Rhodomonas_salina.1